jgi:methenyltetrahydrofolate cyclohydrolase
LAGLADSSLARFLADVAQATPAPGAGSSSAVVAGIAAGLVEMTAALAGMDDAAGRAAELRARSLELAERELTSYAPVIEARRLPDEDPDRDRRIEEALDHASEAPREIAALAAEAAALARRVAEASKPSVRADALAAATLADAAERTAISLVETNLGG